MIKRLTLKNFKSIKDAHLELGAFNLFIGTNASGKSNLFDALRFLQGIGWGLSIDEILNGRPRSGTGSEWEGLRGGSGHLQWEDPNSTDPKAKQVKVAVDMVLHPSLKFPFLHSYGISINTSRNCVREEYLEGLVDGDWDSRSIGNAIGSPVVSVEYNSGRRGRKPHHDFQKHRPIIQQIQSDARIEPHHRKKAQSVLESLRNTQRLDPQPGILRQYAAALEVERMGERGENFASLVEHIRSNEKLKEGYLGWLRELRPAEVDDIDVLRGALREPMFALVEKGRTFPAPVLSDGTLRFAAIAAAFFQPSMPEVLMLEEIENGIHAGRLRLLLELLKSRAGATHTQVLATSHSALLLDWLSPVDYKHVFLCSRDPENGVTQITPLSEVPHFLEAVQTTPASQLIAEGWMENAL